MNLARSCSCFEGALISVIAIHSRRMASLILVDVIERGFYARVVLDRFHVISRRL